MIMPFVMKATGSNSKVALLAWNGRRNSCNNIQDVSIFPLTLAVVHVLVLLLLMYIIRCCYCFNGHRD